MQILLKKITRRVNKEQCSGTRSNWSHFNALIDFALYPLLITLGTFHFSIIYPIFSHIELHGQRTE